MTFAGAREHIEIARNAGTAMMGISTVSMWLFLIARCVLATGEAGNFPCAMCQQNHFGIFPSERPGLCDQSL